MTPPAPDAATRRPALTVPALLAERAAGHGDDVFVSCDDGRLTFADAEARSADLARRLLAMGVSTGTHVGLLYPNSIEFVVAWLATCRIGAVAAPFSTFSTARELGGLFRGAGIAVLLSAQGYRDTNFVERLGEVLPGADPASDEPLMVPDVPALRRVVFDGAQRVSPVPVEVLHAADGAVSPGDDMVIIHTSGSTSEPKAVVHCHRPLIAHLDNLNRIRRLTRDEVLFANSPWFWIGGFAFALLGCLVAGATLVSSASADAEKVLDLIETERPTMVNGFAAAVEGLTGAPSFPHRDLSSIRRGNLYPIMPPEVVPADTGLRHSMLGLTEAGSVCLIGEEDEELDESRRGSFGRPAPEFETMVVDLDTGERLASGEVGELWLRSPHMMDRYLAQPRWDTFDADGWFRTGDLFHVDGDGLHYFHGRAGSMIKTAGANVAPAEVEAAIEDATGLRSHVIGVDDDVRGQVVAALLVADAGVEVDLEGLRSQLRERLSAYKVPRRYKVVTQNAVPMMSSGKVDLRALAEMFDEDHR